MNNAAQQDLAGESLELSILDAYAQDYAIALARRDDDIAIRKIPFGDEVQALTGFRDRLDTALRGMGTAMAPTATEIEDFGRKLFHFTIGGDLLRLYNRLPQTHVSLKILTNHAELRKLPWEYWQEPDQALPRTGRCVVRVIPTIGKQAPPPMAESALNNVLLVAADPIGLTGVSWQDIKDTIERVYNSRLGTSKLALTTIEGAEPLELLTELQTRPFDIVHFSCHGDVKDGMGRLMLVNSQTRRTAFITADELGRTLAGRDIRLVILSACDTSTPTAADFGSTAETLIAQGIPAVVANQAPVPNASMAPFVGALYTELRRSGNIDKAVTQGRITLSATKGPEWGITTLHRLSGAAQLYQV